jgi:hypothetical protein
MSERAGTAAQPNMHPLEGKSSRAREGHTKGLYEGLADCAVRLEVIDVARGRQGQETGAVRSFSTSVVTAVLVVTGV